MSTPVTRLQLRRKRRFTGTVLYVAGALVLPCLLGIVLNAPFVVSFDEAAGSIIRGLEGEPLRWAAQWFDAIGSTLGFALLALAFALICVALRRPADAILIALAAIVSWGLNSLLKMWIERPRPAITEALFAADGFSFPSGNATLAATLFGCAILLFASGARSPKVRWAVSIASFACIFLIGAFRIYAGVHYATDIIGGYLLGAACLPVVAAIRRRAD